MSPGSSHPRVVITGMGAITPLGLTVDEFWQGCVEGRSGAGPLTLIDPANYPTKIACEVKGFDPLNYMDRREARRMALRVPRHSRFHVDST